MTLLVPNAPNREAVDELLASVAAWARDRNDVKAVALVGSWARDAVGPGSDVDIVILTSDPTRYLKAGDWARSFGIESFGGRKSWGALTECRGVTKGGIEVEFGIAEPSWASTDPPDPGTMRVVGDSLRVLYDPDGILARLTR